MLDETNTYFEYFNVLIKAKEMIYGV